MGNPDSTFYFGKTHYFDWAIFNGYVKLPEGIGGKFSFPDNPKMPEDAVMGVSWCLLKLLLHDASYLSVEIDDGVICWSPQSLEHRLQ